MNEQEILEILIEDGHIDADSSESEVFNALRENGVSVEKASQLARDMRPK